MKSILSRPNDLGWQFGLMVPEDGEDPNFAMANYFILDENGERLDPSRANMEHITLEQKNDVMGLYTGHSMPGMTPINHAE